MSKQRMIATGLKLTNEKLEPMTVSGLKQTIKDETGYPPIRAE